MTSDAGHTGAAGHRRAPASAWPQSFGEAVGLWPWVGSLIAGGVVVVLIGVVRHEDFHGIEGFSTTNYGWLAFSLVGGVGLSVRLAGRPATWQLLLRPLLAAGSAFTVCFGWSRSWGCCSSPRSH